MQKLYKGQRVKFNTNQLGGLGTWDGNPTNNGEDLDASKGGEVFAAGDGGVVKFEHPNQKMCKGWWFVEVESKADPGRKRYVGVTPRMVDAL